MLRGPLAKPSSKGQFSGHDTFPLRHLWLRKAYVEVNKRGRAASRSLFSEGDSIITFGVGKNMVSSIRHWALACQVINETGGVFTPTRLGDFLFSDKQGRDQFMESSATTWLIQWLVAGRPERTTTWFYAFNYYPGQGFDREALSRHIFELCRERQWKKPSAVTIKRDVECFIRSYVSRASGKGFDDALEFVLPELGLIRSRDSKSFQFQRGPKLSLPDGVFLFALYEFWQSYAPSQNTLAIESIAFEPGSPGRVFKLDEFSMADRLVRIDEMSNGRFLWSDTAGIRSVARRDDEFDSLELLDLAYNPVSRQKAA